MESPNTPPTPKKACIINLMFSINSNEDAMLIKEKVDELAKNIKEKRYTFQIVET